MGVDERCTLVRDCCQGLFPLFQGEWTLCWQSPDGSLRKKQVDFVFTNQTSSSVVVSEDMQLRSDHKPLCVSRRQADGVMLSLRGKRSAWLVGFHHRCHSTMTSRVPSLGTLFWAPRLVTCNTCMRMPCCRSTKRGIPESMTDAEMCLDVARQELRETMSSESVQKLNVSSLGRMSSHETMVHGTLRCLKRAVAEHQARVTAERRLASLRRLSGKVVHTRHRNFSPRR